MARTGLAAAARVARWADASLGPGSDGATPDGKGTLADATAERAAEELGLTPAQVRGDWDTARLAGLVEVHGDIARPGWRLRAWNRDDSAVLRGWVALFDAWSLAHPEPADREASAVAEVVSAMPQVLSFLQLSAGNIEQPASDMLRGCAQLRPNAARAEYRAWLAARPVGSAVTELLEAARGEDALTRGLAFEALRVVGAPAEPDVRAVADESWLRPYALLWLAEHDGHDPEDAHEVLTREESTWLWVDTAAAVADHGEAPLLVRHLESAVQPTVPALLDEVRAVGHPRTVQVLVALAAAHPDPALAKAVRRAAFQVHTGGS
ncbi:hypothetical protein ACFWIZ_02610 [Streptomyces sp. NPDC127044]